MIIDPLAFLTIFLDSSLSCVDTRSRIDFQETHLIDSTSIPFESLWDRVHELPPHGASLIILFNKDLPHTTILEAATRLSVSPYQITKICTVSAQFLCLAEEEGLLTTGGVSRRLWKASPCLEECIELIEKEIKGIKEEGEGKEEMKGGGLLAYDLACGGGRDAVFLGERGWQVKGYDVLSSQVAKASLFALSSSLHHQVTFFQIDLQDPLSLSQLDQADLVCVSRYLHRPLFSRIRSLVKKGGFVVYHTFMEGCRESKVGRPRKEQFLLKENELRLIFDGWKIFEDRIFLIPDGRPLSFFVAQNVH
eukprot:TRINITY_DN854_c0_g1_i6.p1 TRINITY_DN854_c0_g1~~TRINITY_DN854_c0_g1_i6.p1  ORF type:complete len:307 (-),score=65.91 TRINITY_DN854_c0_g1_i6:162-1082(-)